jgi:hypothetical protein
VITTGAGTPDIDHGEDDDDDDEETEVLRRARLMLAEISRTPNGYEAPMQAMIGQTSLIW